MKPRYLIGIIIALVIGFGLAMSYTRVPQGYVGVKFNKFGSEKGVQLEQLAPGGYFTTLNESVELFPTYIDTYTWKEDEAIKFQDKNSLSVVSDVSITYKVNPNKAAILFQEYRKGIDDIRAKQLRDLVVDAMVKRASQLDIVDIAGTGKPAFIASVQADVQKQVAPLGIVVTKVALVGETQLPDQVKRAIDEKITANQKALTRQNQVAEATAAAAIAVAKAKGEKDSAILAAQGRAEAMDLEGKALARNPDLLKLRYIEKWDGTLPKTQVTGSAGSTNLHLPTP